MRTHKPHPLSSILHPLSSILHPLSSILHPLSSILYPLSSILYLLSSTLLSTPAQGQVYLRQTIKGTVYDKVTKAPLVGATVILVNSSPLVGTTTNQNGEYRLEKIPVGKHQITVSYIGYATYTSDIVVVTSGKELVLDVELQEMVLSAKEVEIKADYRKYEAINKMATVSVRSFSVDETNRFAGSYGDPGRMVANFAGVTSGIDNRNDIIVRGNSPSGMQWRLDEFEIPNPNHFAAVGTTGGPVTVVNDNLLTNSDFMTGAFSSEYGNTIAGVFDLKIRTGNAEKREYWGEIGWNGLELGAEGPFTKKSKASYIIAYRYSLLDFIHHLGIEMDVVPKYQDLNFKFSFPTKKAGLFTLVGMGGLSYIQLYDSRLPQGEWTFPEYGQDLSNGSNLAVFGGAHTIFLTPTLRVKSNLYVTASRVYTAIDTFNILRREPAPWAGENSSEVKYSFSTKWFKKFSNTNNLEWGVLYDWFHLHYADSIRLKGVFKLNTNSTENMGLIRAFVQWQHRFSDFVSLTTGVNGQQLSLNGSYSIEPRLGFNWIVDAHHSFNIGGGMYSQLQPKVMYFVLAENPDGTYFQTNRNLDFIRSIQVALGYNYLFLSDFRIKAEVYYQNLYSAAVKQSIPEYSVINQGHEFFVNRQYSDSLVNDGGGINYGIECTLEKFFSKNYFFLFTASLFNSTYTGYDHIERNSTFDAQYAFNGVAGYELKIGKKKLGVLSFGIRGTWTGGNPYIPFDVAQTVATRETTMDWAHSYEPRYPAYKRISFRIGVTRNRPSYSMSFMLDLQYRTNYTNIYLQQIDVITGKIYTFYQMGFFPMGTWKIQF